MRIAMGYYSKYNFYNTELLFLGELVITPAWCFSLYSATKSQQKLQFYCEDFLILLSHVNNCCSSCRDFYDFTLQLCPALSSTAMCWGTQENPQLHPLGTNHFSQGCSLRSALLYSLERTGLLLVLYGHLLSAKQGRDGKDRPVPLSLSCSFPLGTRGNP